MRRIPIHRAANRQVLFLGGDRSLVLICMLASIALVATSMWWVATLCGVALWFVSLMILRSMAKADPMMKPVYMRHRQYKRFYMHNSYPESKQYKSKRFSSW